MVAALVRVALEAADERLDLFDAVRHAGACAEIRAFLDALNNWYIRRSRARFWRGELEQDKRDAEVAARRGQKTTIGFGGQTIRRAEEPNVYVRMIVTRGSGPSQRSTSAVTTATTTSGQ